MPVPMAATLVLGGGSSPPLLVFGRSLTKITPLLHEKYSLQTKIHYTMNKFRLNLTKAVLKNIRKELFIHVFSFRI